MAVSSKDFGNSSSNSSNSVPVILRIKRRRCEDPADALVVLHAAKTPKYVCETEQSVEDYSDRSVFHFAGTLQGEEAKHDKYVFERVSREMQHRSKLKPNPFAKLTISTKRDSLKAVSKLVATQFKYKLLDDRRSLGENVGTCSSNEPRGDTAPDLASKDHITDLFISGKKTGGKEKKASNYKDHVKHMSRMYDLLQEEQSEGEGEEEDTRGTSLKGVLDEKVTCNGVEMTRERVSKGSSSTVTMATSHDRSHDSSDGEYVTDVYYTENCPEMDTDTFDWNTLMAIEEPDLVYDIFDSNEDSYDEEDSNDEGNIRNDYPDEEDYSRSEDSNEEDPHDSEDDEDTIRYYRNRRHQYKEAIFDDTEDFYNDFDSQTDHLDTTDNNWYVANTSKLGAVVMETKGWHGNSDYGNNSSMEDNSDYD